MRRLGYQLYSSVALIAATCSVVSGQDLAAIFQSRGFEPEQVSLPNSEVGFPADRLRNVRFETVAKFDWFPEGPSFRPGDNSYFFSGNQALTRVGPEGKVQVVVGRPGGGGTHFLPDGSVLVIGHVGLRRVYPDGRIELIADGEKVGAGNDLTVGIHGEVYFSVPKRGIIRVTPGKDGRVEQVSHQGCNGLDVDPTGKFLYVIRGDIQRYPIAGPKQQLGEPELVYAFPKAKRGGDGCTFDAWGNLYSMHFRTGVIRVVSPERKELIAEIPVGVAPATNLTFGGSKNTELFVTAGVPRLKNCQVLKSSIGVTGFCGHAAASKYPVVRVLDERANAEAFGVDAAETKQPKRSIP